MVAGQVPAPFDPDWVALKLLEGDAEITRKAKGWAGKRVWPGIEALLSAHEDAVLDIAGGRYEWIGRMVRAAVTRPRLGQVSLTDKLDRVAVHPLWGLVLLFSVFAPVFWFTFTLAVPLQEWLDVTAVGQARAAARCLPVSPPAAGLDAHPQGRGMGGATLDSPVMAAFVATRTSAGYLAAGSLCGPYCLQPG